MFNVLIKFTLNCMMANGLTGRGSVLVRSPYVNLDVSLVEGIARLSPNNCRSSISSPG